MAPTPSGTRALALAALALTVAAVPLAARALAAGDHAVLEGETAEPTRCLHSVGDGFAVLQRSGASLKRLLRVPHTECDVAFTGPFFDADLLAVRFSVNGNGGQPVCGRWVALVDLESVATSDEACVPHEGFATVGFPPSARVPGRGFRLAWSTSVGAPQWGNGLLDTVTLAVVGPATTVEGESGAHQDCSEAGMRPRAGASGGSAVLLGNGGCRLVLDLPAAGFVRGIRFTVGGNGGADVCGRWDVVQDGAVAGRTRPVCAPPGAWVVAPMEARHGVTVTGGVEIVWWPQDSPAWSNGLLDAVYVDSSSPVVRIQGESGTPLSCAAPVVRHQSSGGAVMLFDADGCRARYAIPDGFWHVRSIRWAPQASATCSGWDVWVDGAVRGGSARVCPHAAGAWHVDAVSNPVAVDGAAELEWDVAPASTAGALDYFDISLDPPTS